MARHPQLDIQVAYCSLQGAEKAMDSQFGVEVAWDIPLLEGYPWLLLPNRAFRPQVGRFFGLVNPGAWKLIKTGGFDAVVVYTGYFCATFWIAMAASKAHSVPILFGIDAHEIGPMDKRRWKTPLKRWIWPRLFRLANMVLVPSSGSASLMRSLGIPAERIALTPYTVDNDWWLHQATCTDRVITRADWGISPDAFVVLFCAKLQPWKRPQDLLKAFAKANCPGAFLVFAGDGPLRSELVALTNALGITNHVRFLGFVNQSKLPGVYRAADLFVLPSEYEAFGVVVNEAMLCGCPVAVSDKVGARFDLISPESNGFVFPVGNVEKLVEILRRAHEDRPALQRMGGAAQTRMASWSPTENIESTRAAVVCAVSKRADLSSGAEQ